MNRPRDGTRMRDYWLVETSRLDATAANVVQTENVRLTAYCPVCGYDP